MKQLLSSMLIKITESKFPCKYCKKPTKYLFKQMYIRDIELFYANVFGCDDCVEETQC